jgi:acyl-CoA thioester hydrolase
MPHVATIDVRFSELDPYGHVNHAVYVSYFEVARTEALAACEIPLQVMAERGFQIVVTSIEVRYRRPAGAGDTLSIETHLSELRRASGTWSQRILRGDELLVTAEVRAGVTDRSGKPAKPPDWLFPALQRLLD